MQPRLMFPDRGYAPASELSSGAGDLLLDLQLQDVLEAMAAGDRLLYQVARDVITRPLGSPETIRYRQQVLQDFMDAPETATALYELCSRALQTERSVHIGIIRPNPTVVLHRSRTVLSQLVPYLQELARHAHTERSRVRSGGLQALYAGLIEDLDEEFFTQCQDHLKRLAFRDGVIIGRRLGPGKRGIADVLHPPERARLTERMGLSRKNALTYQLPARDEAAAEELATVEARGINQVANATAQAADYLRGLFQALQYQVGFYLGCVNLQQRLHAAGRPTCLPTLLESGNDLIRGTQIYDPRLGLAEAEVVGNDIDPGVRTGMVLTGANSGGKSTLLRAIGCAQLMAQAGMFCPAKSWAVQPASTIFTHFAREEDTAMVGGRFFDELKRLSTIVDQTRPGGWILMNETFSGTNESEAADLGADLIDALGQRKIATFLVTHNFDLAGRLVDQDPGIVSLRAQRLDSGQRTFRLLPAEPLPTSFGRDIYDRIGGWDAVAVD